MNGKITYGRARVQISVMVSGKKVGEIRNYSGGGYWYVPKGITEGGEVFKRITQVKTSLQRES